MHPSERYPETWMFLKTEGIFLCHHSINLAISLAINLAINLVVR